MLVIITPSLREQEIHIRRFCQVDVTQRNSQFNDSRYSSSAKYSSFSPSTGSTIPKRTSILPKRGLIIPKGDSTLPQRGPIIPQKGLNNCIHESVVAGVTANLDPPSRSKFVSGYGFPCADLDPLPNFPFKHCLYHIW